MKNEKNRENRKNRKNRESRKRMEHIKKRFFNCPGHKKAVLFLCLCLMIIMTGCGEKIRKLRNQQKRRLLCRQRESQMRRKRGKIL